MKIDAEQGVFCYTNTMTTPVDMPKRMMKIPGDFNSEQWLPQNGKVFRMGVPSPGKDTPTGYPIPNGKL